MLTYLFPDVDRVVYGKSQLVEVICQVRFPVDLRVETMPPAEFQQRIRNHFPLLVEQKRATLSSLPPEVAKAFEAVMPPVGNSTIWRFSTEDGQHSLELLKDNLTLMSRNYRRWEDFYGLFREPLAALMDLYKPGFFTRVGLRYRDIIRRSELGLGDSKWSSLLRPPVLAEIAEHRLEDLAIEASRNVLLKLPDQNAKVRLQHGLAEIEDTGEQAYLIDCDFFVERTEIGDASTALEYFHGNAARFFRWCITPTLHEAMVPARVEA